MANIIKGTASFTLGEGSGAQTYDLVLNNRMLMDAEAVLGYSAFDAVEEVKAAVSMGRNPMLRTVVALFYGALVQKHPDVDQNDAIDMFMDDNRIAAQAFLKLLEAAAPPADKGPAGNAGVATRKPRTATKSRGAGKKSSKAGARAGSRRKNSG